MDKKKDAKSIVGPFMYMGIGVIASGAASFLYYLQVVEPGARVLVSLQDVAAVEIGAGCCMILHGIILAWAVKRKQDVSAEA